MEETFCSALSTSPDELLSLVGKTQLRSSKAALKAAIHRSTKTQAERLCRGLALFAGMQVEAFQTVDSLQFEQSDSFKTPSPKHKRRKRARASSPTVVKGHGQQVHNNCAKRNSILKNLKACALIAQFCLSHPNKSFQPCELFPTVQTLHDQLVYFEDDVELQDTIAVLCEIWWKDKLPGKESLIAQSVPFLLSKSLEVGRKVIVHRVYSMREAFTLFDFTDETIEDLKHLLMRCVLTPGYLRLPDGRRFISFLFNLNTQLTKELIIMIRSQIPFGRKSILDSYGEILFRAWRTASGPCLYEIEESCIQGLVEGAVYASSKTLASSVRKVLSGFIAQRTQEGVEALLFRLQEPILFRCLQVANSNVRRNALLLMIDMFPLENLDASKEDNDILLDRQFMFFEKLLTDACPDVRVTAVEGVCRVLRLFWEVISSGTTVKLLTKVVDETAQDQSSTAVRCAVLQGVTYLLENPASHDLLKVLLPRLGALLADTNLAVRIAMADLLLAIKDIRSLSFVKVTSLETLLSTLETDKPPVARRLTRLLIPSYFPSKVPIAEACKRCVALVKRSPTAGVRFCEWAMLEGVPQSALVELVRVFVGTLNSLDREEAEEKEGIFRALNQLCHSLASKKELKEVLGEVLTRQNLKAMLSNATTSTLRTLIVQLVSVINPTDVPELFEYCTKLVTDFTINSMSSLSCNEARAVHALMLAWGGFDDLIQALVKPLTQDFVGMEDKGNLSKSRKSAEKTKLDSKSPWSKSMKKSCHGKGRKGKADSLEQSHMECLESALGAAWHVENLLEVDETRQAVLAHKSLPALVSGLRNTVCSVLHSGLYIYVPEVLKGSPIRAYAALTVHMGLLHRSVKKAPSTPTKESTMNQKDHILCVFKELMEWAACLQKFKEPSSPVVSKKKEAKRARNFRPGQREALADISNNTPCGTSFKSLPDIETLCDRIKLSNTCLGGLFYFLSLKLLDGNAVQDVCMEFTARLLKWVMGELKRMAALEAPKNDLGVKMKDILPCLRCSTTHAAKMLYLTLSSNIETGLHCSELAHCLLDMIVLGNSLFGAKGSMSLITAINPWIPDLFISISSLGSALNVDQMEAGATIRNLDDLACLGDEVMRPWMATFARSVFEEQAMEPPSPMDECADGMEESAHEAGECSGIQRGQSFSFPAGFLGKVTKILKRGDPKVLEGVSIIFLWYAMASLKAGDYRGAVGALDLVSRKFLECHTSLAKRDLPGPLVKAYEVIGRHVECILETTALCPEFERKRLCQVKELVHNLQRTSSPAPTI